jgi:hypothetical protein
MLERNDCKESVNQVWGTSIIPTLGRLRKGDQLGEGGQFGLHSVFKATLG